MTLNLNCFYIASIRSSDLFYHRKVASTQPPKTQLEEWRRNFEAARSFEDDAAYATPQTIASHHKHAMTNGQHSNSSLKDIPTGPKAKRQTRTAQMSSPHGRNTARATKAAPQDDDQPCAMQIPDQMGIAAGVYQLEHVKRLEQSTANTEHRSQSNNGSADGRPSKVGHWQRAIPRQYEAAVLRAIHAKAFEPGAKYVEGTWTQD